MRKIDAYKKRNMRGVKQPELEEDHEIQQREVQRKRSEVWLKISTAMTGLDDVAKVLPVMNGFLDNMPSLRGDVAGVQPGLDTLHGLGEEPRVLPVDGVSRVVPVGGVARAKHGLEEGAQPDLEDGDVTRVLGGDVTGTQPGRDKI